jgi:hypothetical protein
VKTLALCLTILAMSSACGEFSWAGSSSPVNILVTGLFDTSSRIPMTMIPFRVSGTLMDQGSLIGVDVASSTAACKTMTDPFRKEIFFLKCAADSDVQLRVKVLTGEKLYSVLYGPVSVKAPAGKTVIPPGGGSDPRILAGRQLFSSMCLGCHTPPESLSGKTVSDVNTAIATIPDMNAPEVKSQLSQLTQTDIQNIVTYLDSL